jgi:hypothetical protein
MVCSTFPTVYSRIQAKTSVFIGTSGSSVLDVPVSGIVRRTKTIAFTNYPIDENMKMTDCYYEKKDWRLCKAEVRSSPKLAISSAYHV